MLKGLFKAFAVFLFILSGFSASASDSPGNKPQATLNTASFLHHQTANNTDNNPFNYESIVNSIPVQVINVQQQRVVHFWQVIKPDFGGCVITVSYLNFICGQGNSQLSQFRKLIIFPFHVFW